MVNSQAKSIWAAIRIANSKNTEQDLKEKLAGWKIINLSYPLRTTKRISKKIKEFGGDGDHLLRNVFNGSLEIVDNMPMGPVPLTIPRSKGSYKERLQYVFHILPKNKSILIIVNYFEMSPSSAEINEAKQSTTISLLSQKTDGLSQNLLVGIEAVKANVSGKDPLIWLNSKYENVSDDKESIKDLMKGSKTFVGRHLITDHLCVAGYESDIIIYIGTNNVANFLSRCKGQFIHITDENEELQTDSRPEPETSNFFSKFLKNIKVPSCVSKNGHDDI